MGASLDDFPLFENNDLIGPLNGGEPMGDDEDSSIAGQVIEGLLNSAFGEGVDAGRCFVENDKGRIAEKDSGDGEALFLSLAQADALFPDGGVQLVWKMADKLPGAGIFERPDDLLLGGRFLGQVEILADGTVEEKGVLGDVADFLVEFLKIELSDIDPVVENGAGGHIVGSHGEVGDG